MKVKSIIPRDEAHWHELRAQHIGGSEVAALFGLSSFMTPFELWHIKAGNVESPGLDDNARVFWGTVLEPAIAKGLAKKEGWQIRKVHRYLSSVDVHGAGASLDYEIINHPLGPAPLEIKNIDWLEFKEWPEIDGVKTPPMKYQLQLQDQIGLRNTKWGCLGVLVGGNDLHSFKVDRHEGAIKKIMREISSFWMSIKEGKAPDPDFGKDYGTLERVFTAKDGSYENLTGDTELEALAAHYIAARDRETAENNTKLALRGEIINRIGKTEKVVLEGFTISRKSAFRVSKRRNAEEQPLENYEIPQLETVSTSKQDVTKMASIF